MNGELLAQRLIEANYDHNEIAFLRNGFLHGFDIRYKGPVNRTSQANNLPLRVGSQVQLWNKLIKEVKLKRVAGPFDRIPFRNYIKSLIGLVPKANNQTRLIFHLSYDFGEREGKCSVNYHTPREECSVHYEDLDCMACTCLKVKELKMGNLSLFWMEDGDGNELIYIGKSDIKSAFCLLCLNKSSWRWLVMKARNPRTGNWQFFIDKCLPFGSSISCAHFQRFSDTLKHLIQHRTTMSLINNYLDDFLFVTTTLLLCNFMIQEFLDMCHELGIPIALDKTAWAQIRIIFWGILLDCQSMSLVVLEEKRTKAIEMLTDMLHRKKATIKELQSLCGYLNFLNKVIIP